MRGPPVCSRARKAAFVAVNAASKPRMAQASGGLFMLPMSFRRTERYVTLDKMVLYAIILVRARTSIGQRSGLRNRLLWVRVPPGAPVCSCPPRGEGIVVSSPPAALGVSTSLTSTSKNLGGSPSLAGKSSLKRGPQMVFRCLPYAPGRGVTYRTCLKGLTCAPTFSFSRLPETCISVSP